LTLIVLVNLGLSAQESLDSLALRRALDDRYDSMATQLERIRIERAENRFSANLNTTDWGRGWFASADLMQGLLGAGYSFKSAQDWRLRVSIDWRSLLFKLGRSAQIDLRGTIATPVMLNLVGVSGYLQAGLFSDHPIISNAQRIVRPECGVGLNIEFWLSPRMVVSFGRGVSYSPGDSLDLTSGAGAWEKYTTFFKRSLIVGGITWFVADYSGSSVRKHR
jgi:hypothetical protein